MALISTATVTSCAYYCPSLQRYKKTIGVFNWLPRSTSECRQNHFSECYLHRAESILTLTGQLIGPGFDQCRELQTRFHLACSRLSYIEPLVTSYTSRWHCQAYRRFLDLLLKDLHVVERTQHRSTILWAISRSNEKTCRVLRHYVRSFGRTFSSHRWFVTWLNRLPDDRRPAFVPSASKNCQTDAVTKLLSRLSCCFIDYQSLEIETVLFRVLNLPFDQSTAVAVVNIKASGVKSSRKSF